MTKMTKVKTSRNTVNKTRSKAISRSRNWCFTLNNYLESDVQRLKSEDYQYVFQEEKGEGEGTPHLQGLIKIKDKKSLKQMKVVNDKAHWEVCRNVAASINYCTKEETRCGEIYTNINAVKKKLGVKKKSHDQMTSEILEKIKSEMKNEYYEKYPEAKIQDEEWEAFKLKKLVEKWEAYQNDMMALFGLSDQSIEKFLEHLGNTE